MIIYTHNILTAPLLIAVWCIDLYLFLAAIRFVLITMQGTQSNGLHLFLQRLTDPIPLAIHRRLIRRRTTPIPGWFPWLIVVFGCLVLRHLLIWIVLKTL